MNYLDQLLAGRVIKDFGPIEERKLGIGRIQRSVLLVERYGHIRLVLKTSAIAFLAASVHYADLSLEAADQLQSIIHESKQIAANLPPLAPEASRQALRAALFALAIVAIVTFLVAEPIVIIAAGIVATLIQWGQISAIRKLPHLEPGKVTPLWVVLVVTPIISLSKLVILWAAQG